MATKKNPDEIRVTLVCDIVISDSGWRELMGKYGRSLEGHYTASHVQKSAKTIVKKKFEEMGFPQPQIPDYKL